MPGSEVKCVPNMDQGTTNLKAYVLQEYSLASIALTTWSRLLHQGECGHSSSRVVLFHELMYIEGGIIKFLCKMPILILQHLKIIFFLS